VSSRNARRRAAGGLAFLLLVVPLAVVVMPTTVLLGVGLIPTLVAFAVDRDSEKSAAITVGAMNFCGVMPFAIQLWQRGHTLDLSMGLIASPFTWLVMYGAAAVGWGLYFVIPPIVASFVVMRDEDKIRDLEEQRQALVEEWGIEVTGQGAEPSFEEDAAAVSRMLDADERAEETAPA